MGVEWDSVKERRGMWAECEVYYLGPVCPFCVPSPSLPASLSDISGFLPVLVSFHLCVYISIFLFLCVFNRASTGEDGEMPNPLASLFQNLSLRSSQSTKFQHILSSENWRVSLKQWVS